MALVFSRPLKRHRTLIGIEDPSTMMYRGAEACAKTGTDLPERWPLLWNELTRVIDFCGRSPTPMLRAIQSSICHRSTACADSVLLTPLHSTHKTKAKPSLALAVVTARLHVENELS